MLRSIVSIASVLSLSAVMACDPPSDELEGLEDLDIEYRGDLDCPGCLKVPPTVIVIETGGEEDPTAPVPLRIKHAEGALELHDINCELACNAYGAPYNPPSEVYHWQYSFGPVVYDEEEPSIWTMEVFAPEELSCDCG